MGTFVTAWRWGVTGGTRAAQVCTASCQAGITGAGVGQLATRVVAVDNSSGFSGSGDVALTRCTQRAVAHRRLLHTFQSTLDLGPDVPKR